MEKICSKCKKELPATTDYFSPSKKGKFGFRSDCKECANKAAKARRNKHIEVFRERTREWRKNNKEYVSEYNKKYRQENKVKVNVLWENYYCKHKDDLLIKKREYNRANTEKVSSWYRKRVSKKKNNICSFTHSDWIKCQKDFNHCCAYCGMKSDRLTREHFHPLNLGGEYTKTNIIPACLSCNASKQDTLFFDWYPKQDFYSKQREKRILKYLNYNNNTQQIAFL